MECSEGTSRDDPGSLFAAAPFPNRLDASQGRGNDTATAVSRVSKQDAMQEKGNASMRHEDAEMLAALRQCLTDLENIKLISPDDLAIVALRASLHQRIADIEEADAKRARAA